MNPSEPKFEKLNEELSELTGNDNETPMKAIHKI